jgi:1-acyl-sn-glycerol-3-phosphate acyltransferase
MSDALTRLRSLLAVGWGVLSVVPWGLTAVLISPFVSATRLYWFCIAWARQFLAVVHWVCGVQPRLSGAAHLPQGRQEAVILLAKHQSALETLALCVLMPHPLAFVFKRELLHIPFFGWALGRLDMVHIDRRKRAEAFNKVAEQGRRLAAQGTWVIMFPEGTRIPRGQVGDYKTGGARLACTTGLPVVPVACATARVLPRGSLLFRPGVYEISVGAPIKPQGHDADSLMQEVKRWIEAEMRRIDPEGYAPAEAEAGLLGQGSR